MLRRNFVRCYSSLKSTGSSSSSSSSSDTGAAKKFDVMSFITRIDAMYESKNKEDPISNERSTFSIKRRKPVNKRSTENGANSTRADARTAAPRRDRQRTNTNNSNNTRTRKPVGEFAPKASIKQNSLRLQSIDSDIDEVLTVTGNRYSQNNNKSSSQGNARSSRYPPRTQANAGAKRPFQQRNKFANKRNGNSNIQSQNRRKQAGSRDRNAKETEGQLYALSAEEGISIITRLVEDPSTVSKFTIVDTQSTLSVTKNLEGNAATAGASVWTAAQRLSAKSSPEEVKRVIDTTIRGLGIDSIDVNKATDLNSTAFVNAVNRNPKLPLHFKQALYDVTTGKAPVSSAVKSSA